MADANVVLKITSDVGNAITGLKSFLDIITMVVSKVLGAAGAIEEFAKAQEILINASNLSKTSIMEADSATSALIDTTALYTEQVKLQQAGVSVTSKQYRAIAVAAAKMGKVTGDATGEFKKLTKAISRGSTGAVERFGIDVEETTNLMEGQISILDALVNMHGDATVSTDGLSEAMFALGNNFDTTKALYWEMIAQLTGMSGWLDNVNLAWGKWNNLLLAGVTPLDLMNSGIARLQLKVISLHMPLIRAETALRKLFNVKGIGYFLGGAMDMAADAESDINNISDKKQLFDEAERQKDLGRQKTQQSQRDYMAYQKMLDGLLKGGKSQSGSSKAKGGSDPLDFVQNPFEDWEQRAMDESELTDLMTFQPEVADSGFSAGGLYADPENMLQSTMMATGKTEFEIADEEAHAEAVKLRADAEKTAHNARMRYLQEYSDAAVEARERNQTAWADDGKIGTSWAETWVESVELVEAKGEILSSVMGGMQRGIEQFATALADGSHLTVKAMANIVKGIARQIAIEAQVRAIMALAYAGLEALMSWGASPRVEGFLVNAAQFQATAIAGFAVASGASRVARKHSGGKANKKDALPGGDFSNTMRGDSFNNVNVTVMLEGDADGLFRVVADKNNEKRRAGEAGI